MASASATAPIFDTIQLPVGRLKIQLKENATTNSKSKTPSILCDNGEVLELGKKKDGSVKTVVDSVSSISFTLVRRSGGEYGYIQTQYLAQAGAALRVAGGVAAPAASASWAAAPLLPGPVFDPWVTSQQKAEIMKSYIPPLTPGYPPVFQMRIPKPADVFQAPTGQYYKVYDNGSPTEWFVQDPATGNYYLSGPEGTTWVGGTRRRKCKKGKKSRASSRSSRRQFRRRHSRHSRRSRRRSRR